MWYEALPVIGWIWVGIMIGTLFGVIVAGILAGSKQADLEIEVINAGSPSATSYDEIKYTEKIIQELEPDLFIVYDGWNDAAHKISRNLCWSPMQVLTTPDVA